MSANNTFSVSTTFAPGGVQITRTTRVLPGGKVVLVQVFNLRGTVDHAEYVVTTPAFKGVVGEAMDTFERFESAKGREVKVTPARCDALCALITEAHLAV